MGTILDGIPESAVLGMSLATGGGVSVALLSAIWLSNFPEALGATVGLEKSGSSRRKYPPDVVGDCAGFGPGCRDWLRYRQSEHGTVGGIRAGFLLLVRCLL